MSDDTNSGELTEARDWHYEQQRKETQGDKYSVQIYRCRDGRIKAQVQLEEWEGYELGYWRGTTNPNACNDFTSLHDQEEWEGIAARHRPCDDAKDVYMDDDCAELIGLYFY